MCYDPKLELESQIRALDSARDEIRLNNMHDPVQVITFVIEKKIRELATLNGITKVTR